MASEMERPAEPTREALLRWLSRHPANRDGADKTWVLQALRRHERRRRSARRLPGKGPDGSVR